MKKTSKKTNSTAKNCSAMASKDCSAKASKDCSAKASAKASKGDCGPGCGCSKRK